MSTPSPSAKPLTPDRLMQLSGGYAPPLILSSALRHKFFDALAGGPLTAEDLAARTGVAPRGARAVLNALVGIDLLTKDAGGRYALTDESRTFLVSTSPDYRGGMIRHVSDQLIPHWLQIHEIVRTGKPYKPVNDQDTGAAFFEEFVEHIFPSSYRAAQALARSLDLAAANGSAGVLDLATGSGVWGIALAEAHPNVRVTAVDWERVLAVTRRVAARHGVADRFTYVAGDIMTADFGTGHRVATLGHILHSEGPERSRHLLRRTFDALAPGGTVAIAEFLANKDRTGPAPAMLFAVNMLVHTEDGDTFSFEEIADWLRGAGFVTPRTLEAPGPSPLVLADKPV